MYLGLGHNWGHKLEMPPVSRVVEVMSLCDKKSLILHLLLFELTTALPNKSHLHLLPVVLVLTPREAEGACCCPSTSIAFGK